jgi:hypothetical protein
MVAIVGPIAVVSVTVVSVAVGPVAVGPVAVGPVAGRVVQTMARITPAMPGVLGIG